MLYPIELWAHIRFYFIFNRHNVKTKMEGRAGRTEGQKGRRGEGEKGRRREAPWNTVKELSDNNPTITEA
jgi:hypothetical protein